MATQAELIAAFREETEDLFKALRKYVYFNLGVAPYTSTDEVLSTIAEADRVPYLTIVNINGILYWFTDSTTLVPLVGNLALTDKSVTLPKMADIIAGTVIGKQTKDGTPEALSMTTLLSMLGLSTIVNDVSNKVDKADGYSLISSNELAKIHESGSDDQDLTAINEAILSLQNIAGQRTYSFTLPSAGTVAERLLGTIVYGEGAEGWTFEADGIDLLVTHSTGRNISNISVSQIGTEGIRPLLNGVGYVGYLAESTSVLRIEGFAASIAYSILTIITFA